MFKAPAFAAATFLLVAPLALPAQAFPIDPGVKAVDSGSIVDVQFRRRPGGGFHGGGFRRGGFAGGARFHGGGYRGGPRYGYGGYRRGYGAAVGAGLAGLAAGAVIGGAIANSAPGSDAVGYCANRYKSYDAPSGTYLGYDGLRHPCP